MLNKCVTVKCFSSDQFSSNYRYDSAVQSSLTTSVLPHIKKIITTGTKYKNIKTIIFKILKK